MLERALEAVLKTAPCVKLGLTRSCMPESEPKKRPGLLLEFRVRRLERVASS